MSGQKFDLGQRVKLAVSDERGEVIGIATYLSRPNSYLVRYKTADGCQTEAWWDGSAIEALETT